MVEPPDASICNRGCKRLQPHLQTFASANSCVHLLPEWPSSDPVPGCMEVHGQALLDTNEGWEEARKVCFWGIGNAEKYSF